VSTRALTAVLPLALLVGCGSSNHSISNVKVTAAPSTGGASTFSAPGMAIHFRFPSRFHPISLAPSKGVAGNTGQATHAAVALTKYDLLRVTRFPNRSVAVTPKNISSVRSTYDRTLSGAFGVSVTSTVTTVGGLPALSYPPISLTGQPVAVSGRVTLVFLGHDEYELYCQYTPKGLAAVSPACNEMLSTLSK